MTRARDQLISDWRQQLAAAESVVAASGRAAWLARVRRRLYRFLLACYGNREWTDAPSAADSEPPGGSAAVLFELAPAADLEGKPARTGGQIRSVLKKVASAQDHPPEVGPLAGGLDAASWVVVAAASSKLRTGRLGELLRAAGLHARTAYRGDDHMVEVPACERHEAFEIVQRYRVRVKVPPQTPRTQPVPLWCRFAAVSVVSMWVTGLLAWMLLAVIWGLALPQQIKPALDYLAMPEFLPIWSSLYVAILLIFSLGLSRRNRPLPQAKQAKRQ